MTVCEIIQGKKQINCTPLYKERHFMLLYCLSVRVADSLNLVWIGLMTRVIGYAASETKARDI